MTGGEAVLLDENIYHVLVGTAVAYGLTWLNALFPSSGEVKNPWIRAILRIWEGIAGNVLRSAPGSGAIGKILKGG